MPPHPNLAAWRAATPGCAHRIHLNNAGAALMPEVVHRAITDHLQLESEMGGYEAADAQAGEIATGYADLAALVGAKPDEIAVTSSATSAFALALSTIDWQAGDRLVTTLCDYTSNQIQYLALARRRGVQILHAPDLPEGGVDPEGVRALVAGGGVKAVAVSWVPTNSGLVQDAESVGAICEEFGVPYLVDACQTVGQMPVDVTRLKCDYLSTTGRKFLRAPRGIGFLYVSERALRRGDHPLFVDMRGADWTGPDDYQVVPTARRFEEWERPYALQLGMAAAARYALEVGLETAQVRTWALAEQLREGLSAIPGVRVLDRGATRCAIVTFHAAGWDSRELVIELGRHRVNAIVSLRQFGIFDFDAKGVEHAVRLSPHYYNTDGEVAAALEAVGGDSRRP
ncbi:MAG TPA: aminotransferase class V-fold PLP-dependent enzyme [Gemmatimonadales bacterium]|nr:aminotransferase class V-fold PLP-dependent enzyme [Gemmatimonadales bacterium]